MCAGPRPRRRGARSSSQHRAMRSAGRGQHDMPTFRSSVSVLVRFVVRSSSTNSGPATTPPEPVVWRGSWWADAEGPPLRGRGVQGPPASGGKWLGPDWPAAVVGVSVVVVGASVIVVGASVVVGAAVVGADRGGRGGGSDGGAVEGGHRPGPHGRADLVAQGSALEVAVLEVDAAIAPRPARLVGGVGEAGEDLAGRPEKALCPGDPGWRRPRRRCLCRDQAILWSWCPCSASGCS
jgi:hypothetical protein